MTFSLFIVPASAETTTSSTFSEWISNVISNLSPGYNWWKNIYNDGNSTAYDNYVSTVNTTLGTSVVGDNCIYLGNWSEVTSFESYLDSSGSYSFSSGSTFSYTGSYNYSRTDRQFNAQSVFVAPVSGSYTLTPYFSGAGSPNTFYLYSGAISSYTGRTPIAYTNNPTAGTSITATLSAGSSYTLRFAGYFCSNLTSGTFTGACRLEYPADGLTTAAGDVDVSSDTRTGSITGDFVSVNGDVYNDCTIFNETTNTYTDPSTGTTTAISTWTYDYATRTYSLYDADGNLITVAYQDQQLVITSGGTATDYSYASDSGGSSSGGSSSGTTIGGLIETLLSGIGDIVGGIVKGVLQILIKAVDALKGIGELFNSLVETVVSLFGDFTSFLSAVFPFLPDEFGTILNLGFILLIAAVVIKKIVG